MGGRVIYSSQSMAWRDRDHRETISGTKELANAISLLRPQHKHTVTCGDQHGVDTCYLTCLDQTHSPPPALVVCPSQSHMPQSQGWRPPTPEDRYKSHQHHISDLHHLQGLSSSGSGGRSHFTSRPAHTLVKCATLSQRPNTAPQQAKRASTDNWTEEEVVRTQQQGTCNTHRRDSMKP